MGIEDKRFSEERIEKEDPDEIIIFQDGNHPGSYFKGKRSEMQLLVNEGGSPMEENNPKLNAQGQIWAPLKYNDSGHVIEDGWRNVISVPVHWYGEGDSYHAADQESI